MLRSYHRGAIRAMLQQANAYDFRQDLDARVLALADLDRVPLIERLIALDTQARARVRAGRRAKRGSFARLHSDVARAECDRLGGIIYFLRFRRFPSGATPEDEILCSALAEKLTAKGQWAGEYSL